MDDSSAKQLAKLLSTLIDQHEYPEIARVIRDAYPSSADDRPQWMRLADAIGERDSVFDKQAFVDATLPRR